MEVLISTRLTKRYIVMLNCLFHSQKDKNEVISVTAAVNPPGLLVWIRASCRAFQNRCFPVYVAEYNVSLLKGRLSTRRHERLSYEYSCVRTHTPLLNLNTYLYLTKRRPSINTDSLSTRLAIIVLTPSSSYSNAACSSARSVVVKFEELKLLVS